MERKNIVTSFLILSLFIAPFCIILSNSFSNNKNITEDEELIGTYIDGEYSENIPNKDTGYVVEKIVCDNNAVGKWDYDNWGITLTNLSKKNKCNIHFRKGVKLANTINLVDTTGKCPTVNDDGTVNVTSAESENSLLCMAPDAYGTSYYFRGNVQNNYVKFANFYWRIIRVNGDGSVRMLYDGTSAHENGEASEDRQIGKSQFNDEYYDNAYVGYMYGKPGSSTYGETHANINDSTIKKYVDNWYEKNIENTIIKQYIGDKVFCNDRTISNITLDDYTNLGYQGENTTYRWYFDPTPVNLTCLAKNDSFSVEDNKNGNSNLKYAIGLLSDDELYLAGGYVKWAVNSKNNFYLYTGTSYWLMSAAGYGSSSAWETRVDIDGNKNGFDLRVNATYGVKPVINLKPNSIKFGDGTINNPYTVE